jgi:streptogramin lyase
MSGRAFDGFCRLLCAGVAMTILAACSSGPGTPGAPGLPVTQPGNAPQHLHKVKAAIRITVPKRKRKRHARVRGHYISASTQAIAIAVTPKGGGTTLNFNANLTPSSPICTPISGTLVCTDVLALVPGAYTATFATYDATLDSNGNPQGQQLSANQNVDFTIVSGVANVIPVTLGGIPATVELVPAYQSSITGNADSGYTLSKCGSDSVSVVGVDADGNAILGPGQPAATLQSDSTTLTVSSPSPATPNAFVITRPSPPPLPGASVHLTATVTPIAGSGGSPVSSGALSMTFNHDICGVFTHFPIPTASSQPFGIATGPDGNIWFTESLGNNIGKMTTAGAVTEYPIPTSASRPVGIVAGPNGGPLWFAESFASKIGEITTGGAISEFPTITADALPQSIAAGSDGALWFTEQQAPSIGRISTGGSVTEYPTSNTESTNSVTAGPDATLWFTTGGSNSIVEAATTGAILGEFPVSPSFAPSSNPTAITYGPDGNLWFTDANAASIGTMTPSGSFTQFSVSIGGSEVLPGLTKGPDGAMWFTDCQNQYVGRITTTGTFTRFQITGAAIPFAAPAQIITGPDGNLWFTEVCANEIARLE